MSTSAPRFPDYGDSGDLAGARRSRRAFRLVVLSCVLVTGALYMTERFLRFELAESHYINALEHNRDSARVFLNSAIEQAAKNSETPNPKYTQALAVRQEEDRILDTYAQAHALDPSNALFTLRYGCQLFLLGQPNRAIEIFQAAGKLPPKNALNGYLEAAAVAQFGKDTAALRDAMVLVAKTNNSGADIVFPRPFWFSGYPEAGIQYAKLQRGIYDEICAPLYHFSERVSRAVEEQIAQRRSQQARTWIDNLDKIGGRLLRSSEPGGTLPAIAGIHIRSRAIELLAGLESQRGNQLNSEAIETRLKLQQALEVLNDFETNRDTRIEAGKREHTYPLSLAGWGLVATMSAFAFTVSIHKLMRLRKSAWTLAHSTLGKAVLAGGVLSLLGILHASTFIQELPGSQVEYLRFLGAIWWVALGILVLFGFIYPYLRLSTPEEVSRKTVRIEEMDETLRLARQAYRRVYMSLAARYFGILAGSFVCMLCVWLLSYRVLDDLYPWQVKLLSTGLIQEETDALQQALRIIE